MRTIIISNILVLLFMLFTSHLDEHDLLYLIHSHQTTSHSHQEHHKTQSQAAASLTVKRLSVASHHKNILPRKMIVARHKLPSICLTGFCTTCFACNHPIPINQFRILRI